GLRYTRRPGGPRLPGVSPPPLGKTLAQGPFPTVVEYSGYAAADPDSPQPSTLITSVLGFATVGVNMRGSGCSGGVIDLFDYPTTADGHEIIEVVAAQQGHEAGKAGLARLPFLRLQQ